MTQDDVIDKLKGALQAAQALQCSHCGYSRVAVFGPTAVEVSRARAAGLASEVERLEDGAVAALLAYHADDGNAAQSGLDLAKAITRLLDGGLRRARGVPSL
jgi:hypothetical protein